MRHTQPDGQPLGRRKLAVDLFLCLDGRDKLVHGGGERRHIRQRQPRPYPAQRRPKHKQGDRQASRDAKGKGGARNHQGSPNRKLVFSGQIGARQSMDGCKDEVSGRMMADP